MLAPGEATPEDGAPRAPRVLYKFHEGYTNAVRRPVYMHDLV